MLALFIAYTLIIMLIYAVEYGVKLCAVKNNKAIIKTNLLRITEPMKVLTALFAVIVIELIVEECFGVITEGFIQANTIFFGIVAVIFVVDYIYGQINLRQYDRVILNVPFSDFNGSDGENLTRKVRGAHYVKRYSCDYLNSIIKVGAKPEKKTLIIKCSSVALLLAAVLIAGCIMLTVGIELDFN